MMLWRSDDRVVDVLSTARPLVVSLAQMKGHLRVDEPDEDALIEQFIHAATAHVERFTQRFLSPADVKLYLPCLPSGGAPVALPGGAVVALTSVMVEGVAFAGCQAFGSSPARLVPAAEWPSVTAEGYPVVIEYQAGFAVVPADLTVAVQMLAAELYERREDASADGLAEVPVSARLLMMPHRIWAA